MHWELWDTESGNLIESFATEAEGLYGARDVLAANAPDFAEHLALGVVRDEGGSPLANAPAVLDGEMLTERISQLPAKAPLPRGSVDNGAHAATPSQSRRALP